MQTSLLSLWRLRLVLAVFATTVVLSEAFPPQSRLAYAQTDSASPSAFLPIDDDARSEMADSIAELEAEANAGSSDAMALLGDYYYNGSFVAQDYAKAFHYYKLAADSDNEEIAGLAAAAVGEMYSQGVGVAKDDKKAFEYFTRSVDAGCAVGLYGQGVCYQNGLGVDKDVAKAVELFNRTIEEGDSRGKIGLAIAYFNGDGGLPRDPARAKQLALEAQAEVDSPVFKAHCADILSQIERNQKGDAAYNLGYRIGNVFGRLLCIGLIVGLIVFVVTKVSKR